MKQKTATSTARSASALLSTHRPAPTRAPWPRAALPALILANGLFAQEEAELPTYELKNIIVTGELWESELQKTTASISVLDEAALDENGTQHFEDIVNSIPNLTWTGGTSRPRYIQIRGIGENSQFEGETPDSTVRFLIDDFDLTGVGTVGNLFDVQQVEILRGPQAGAFGANAAGGVVKIVSNEPTSVWTGQSEATVGNDSLYALGFAVGGPVLKNDPEQLTFRFSINSLNQDGFRKNQFFTKDDTNERDELTSRLRVRWLPNEFWSFETGLLYADADNGYDEFTLNNEAENTYSDKPGRDEQKTRGVSLKTKFNGMDRVELTYTGQFIDTDSLYRYDADWGIGFGTAPPLGSGYSGVTQIEREREVSSHEFRLDSKDKTDALSFIDRWTIGLYHGQLDEQTLAQYLNGDSPDNAAVTSEYETVTTAIFTQAVHEFASESRLILGLRYENHQVDFSSLTLDNSDLDFDGSPDLLPGGVSHQSDDLWGGKITLEQDLSHNQSVFASITRGYKSGGANSGAFRRATDPATYESEKIWNYELGLRSRWLDGTIDSQITLFYLDRENAQLRDSVGSGGFFRFFTSNAGSASHYGLETEAKWYLADNWTLSGSLGLLEAESQDLSRDLSNAPSFKYNSRLDYQSSGGVFAHVEVGGSDSYFESNSHNEKRGAYSVVNGSIGYRLGKWTLTLWAKNLFDEDYEERVFFFDNFHPDDGFVPGSNRRYEAPAAPRNFGVTANYRW